MKAVVRPALHLAEGLDLPIDTVTSTIVIYGGRGTGKTNLASVLVEELALNHLRFSVIDPMGVWWGLRHDASGRGAGIETVIFGGIHGDLPIEPTSGADVADFVADEDASVIIDISRRADGSMWAITERVRFVTAYAKRLYQRQGEKRRPIHQVIDEAARYAPQLIRQGEGEVAACMGAIAVLVEEGRNVGIGVTLVTQRSARLNKDVAELADCMIAFRIVGPNSMRAVLDWLGEYVDKARIKDISDRLRSLPRGSALVVSPGWLELEGIVAMRMRRTFDSSKTPEAGQDVLASGAGAKPDLGKYRLRFAKAIEEAKSNDPRALKVQIAELERQLVYRARLTLPANKVVEKSVIKAATIARVEKVLESSDAVLGKMLVVEQRLNALMNGLGGRISDLRTEIRSAAPAAARDASAVPATASLAVPTSEATELARAVIRRATRNLPAQLAATTSTSARAKGDGSLSKCERAMMIALAQHPDGLTRKQVLIFTGYRHSGTTTTAFARLLAEEFVEMRNGLLVPTSRGMVTLGPYDELPVGDALRASLLSGGDLSTMEKEILRRVCVVYPNAIGRTDARGDYAHSGSTTTAFARLITMSYVHKAVGGGLRAADELFGS